MANKIFSQKKINDSTYVYQLSGMYEAVRTITIHLIGKENGVAVFEEKIKDVPVHLYWMIAAEKIRSVPIIENDCQTQKQREFIFDVPEIDSLLRNRKQNK